MKMKKACESTALTERAIRLYIKKNLISPRQNNGIIDFSDEDIQQLKDIALLRQFDFAIEQISCMIHDSSSIPAIVLKRLENAQTSTEHENEVREVLNGLAQNHLSSLHSVAAQIRQHNITPPEPNFGRFDEISDEVRQQEKRSLLRRYHTLKRKRRSETD